MKPKSKLFIFLGALTCLSCNTNDPAPTSDDSGTLIVEIHNGDTLPSDSLLLCDIPDGNVVNDQVSDQDSAMVNKIVTAYVKREQSHK